MKNIIWGFAVTLVAFFAILVVVTISGQMTRKKDVNSSLTQVLDQAIENVMDGKTYTINDSDEFVADIIENLLVTYSNNSDVTIKIAKADKEKGIISLRVVETYKNPDGSTNTYTYDKTVLLEVTDTERSFEIVFLNKDGSIFQKIISNGTEPIQAPKIKPAGVTGWKRKGTTQKLTDAEIEAVLISEDTIFEPCY